MRRARLHRTWSAHRAARPGRRPVDGLARHLGMGPRLAVPHHSLAAAVPRRAPAVAEMAPRDLADVRRRWRGDPRDLARPEPELAADVPQPGPGGDAGHQESRRGIRGRGAGARGRRRPDLPCRADHAVPPQPGRAATADEVVRLRGDSHPRAAAGQHRPRHHPGTAGHGLRGRDPAAGRDRHRDPEVPPVRHRRRHQQDRGVRGAGRVHHRGLRRLLVVGIGSWPGPAGGRTWDCRSWRPRWWRWRSSRSGSAPQRLANRLVYGRRATPYRRWRSCRSGWAAPTPPRACCRRWPRSWRGRPARGGPMSGCGTAGSCAPSPAGTAAGPRPGPVALAGAACRRPRRRTAPPLVEVRHEGELLGALSITKKRGTSRHPDRGHS